MSALRKMARNTTKLSTGDSEVLARVERALRSSETDILRRLEELSAKLERQNRETERINAARFNALSSDIRLTISYRLLRAWRSVVSFFTRPIGKRGTAA